MERSGAAQGLAEVLGVLGTDYVKGLLPDILQSCTSRNPYVREGHLTLFKFLPGALSDIFQVWRLYALGSFPSIWGLISSISKSDRHRNFSFREKLQQWLSKIVDGSNQDGV